MYRERSKQLSFYDETNYAAAVPKGRFLRRLNETSGFSFLNDLCKNLYFTDNSLPSCELQVLSHALFLHFLYNLNDYTVEYFGSIRLFKEHQKSLCLENLGFSIEPFLTRNLQ